MSSIKLILATIAICILAACGGGGTTTENQPSGAVINGVASKGIIINGTVTVFALNSDGSKGAQLGTGRTGSNGAYSIRVGSYTGPVMVEVYGGYTDEATGLPATIPVTAPLRAVLANATGAVSLSVTPLTDLAVRQAGALTAANITAANALISELFKVDIVATAPAAPTASAFQSSATTRAQKDYALALAAVSQLMKSGGTLETTLNSLNSGISSTGMDQQTATTITAAVSDYIAAPANMTGVTTITDTSLQYVGVTTLKLTVALQGSAATSVKGIQGTVTLPAGVSFHADATGNVANGVITAAASAPSGIIAGKYTSAANGAPATVTFGYLTSGSMAAGDVMILNADLSPGISAQTVGAFTISAGKLVDANGNVVSEAALTIR